MTAISAISSDYQVTIPEALWEKLGWRPGQKLAFLPKGHGVLIIAEPTNEDLVGLARGANTDDYRDRNDRY
jgi:bifunctional DNA-binding transcriptional regulator/antitoxin component of YhaV-PrlF toxin-antitoxin module